MAKEQEKKASVEAVYMEKRVFEPTKEFVEKARIKSLAEYKKMYDRSLKDPSGFWGDMATEMIDWFKKWMGRSKNTASRTTSTSAISWAAS